MSRYACMLDRFVLDGGSIFPSHENTYSVFTSKQQQTINVPVLCQWWKISSLVCRKTCCFFRLTCFSLLSRTIVAGKSINVKTMAHNKALIHSIIMRNLPVYRQAVTKEKITTNVNLWRNHSIDCSPDMISIAEVMTFCITGSWTDYLTWAMCALYNCSNTCFYVMNEIVE